MKNRSFWHFENHQESDDLAIITETNQKKSYFDLNEDVICAIEKLRFNRSLIFLQVNNSYSSLVNYLACLRARHPFLLLDSDIKDGLIATLKETFKPNYLLSNDGVVKFSDHAHVLHEDLAMLMSTSGTTGEAKLVRLSYENLHSNSHSIVNYLNIVQSDAAITTLPMSYSYGLSVINSHLGAGATLVLNSHGIISREFWKAIEENQVTTFSGVPFTFQTLKKLKYKRFDTSSIRYVTQAGGKLDLETIEYFVSECSQLGQDFVVMYGQTEASPRISYVPPDRLADKIGAIGISVPGGKLYLKDENGTIIKTDNRTGEIYYEGENVMMGYAESVSDFGLGNTQLGILATGDIGYFDEDGFYYISGRLKRFIKLFGLRISLDAIDNWLDLQEVSAISTGKDDLLKICFEGVESEKQAEIMSLLSKEFKLNVNFIKSITVDEIPRVNGGKIDFKSLNQLVGLNL
jgi:long-chain acyl-CoA synthetase